MTYPRPLETRPAGNRVSDTGRRQGFDCLLWSTRLPFRIGTGADREWPDAGFVELVT